jgi:hypothetical protein
MPFWGLVITSLGFSIPALLAMKKKKKTMGKMCTLLTGTSVLYHGTQHIFFKTIDMMYAHGLGVTYFFRSIKRVFQHKRVYDIIICMGTVGSVLIFYKGACNNTFHSTLQNYYHMSFHILSQSMLSLHALDEK